MNGRLVGFSCRRRRVSHSDGEDHGGPGTGSARGKSDIFLPRGHSTKRLLLSALVPFWETGRIALPLSQLLTSIHRPISKHNDDQFSCSAK